ncbi:RNA methyltransferase [Candidatus Kapabacteria bacterium]|nr:RNA methyltransferase [Candidatus Kapabacteria bacterium]
MSNIDYTEIRTKERVEKVERVLSNRQPDLKVVMENVHDPHNISAALRSCDATGILDVDLIYHTGQTKPKLGKQSSASAKKWVNCNYYNDLQDCFTNLKKDGFTIFTTHLATDSVDLYEMDFTQKIALVFGNEHEGVTEKALSLSDGNFIIPQVGMIQSLNISVSVAVTLYEAYRQRYLKGFYNNSRFDKTEHNNKLNEWLSK